jgi:hypothetical protein
VSRHVLPRLGGRTLSSLRNEDVDRLIAELEADGKAPGTVRNVIVPLRKMLADAVRQGLIVANPAARADLECPRFRGHLSAWSALSDRAGRMRHHAKGIELPEAVSAGVSA